MLPTSLDAFREHCQTARSFADRELIVRTIRADFEQPPALLAAVCEKRGLDPRRLYGDRLIAFLESTYAPNASGRWPTFQTTHELACREASLQRHEPLANLLRRWLQANDRQPRLSAAFFIGHLASDGEVELACDIAADPDTELSAHLLSGAGETASIHASAEFRRRVFDAGCWMLNSQPGATLSPSVILDAREFVQGLLSIDRERTMQLLTSERCIRLDNPRLGIVLRALVWRIPELRIEHFALSANTLWSVYTVLLSAAQDDGFAHDNRALLGNLLKLCAVIDPDSAIIEAKEVLRNKLLKKQLRESAEEAIRIAMQIPELHLLTERVECRPVHELNEHERVLLAVEPWNYTVNDGLIGYFVYRSERVAGAIESLRVIRQNRLADELEAAALVVRQLPDAEAEVYESTVLTKQVNQVEKLLDRKASAVMNAVERYVFKHREQFKLPQ